MVDGTWPVSVKIFQYAFQLAPTVTCCQPALHPFTSASSGLAAAHDTCGLLLPHATTCALPTSVETEAARARPAWQRLA